MRGQFVEMSSQELIRNNGGAITFTAIVAILTLAGGVFKFAYDYGEKEGYRETWNEYYSRYDRPVLCPTPTPPISMPRPE